MNGEIKVVITDNSKKESGNNKTATNFKTGETSTDNNNEKEVNYISLALISFAMKRAVQITKDIATYEIEKQFDLNDDFESKRDLHIAVSLINKTVRIGAQTFAGAKIGAAVGPVGAVVGAVVGFGFSVGSEVVNVSQAFNKQSITMRQRNAQLEYTRQRAGYSLTSGSIGDNR